ncbi:alpha/beta hydrolase fold domain-containing protein [Yinghuangia aomiensis]
MPELARIMAVIPPLPGVTPESRGRDPRALRRGRGAPAAPRGARAGRPCGAGPRRRYSGARVYCPAAGDRLPRWCSRTAADGRSAASGDPTRGCAGRSPAERLRGDLEWSHRLAPEHRPAALEDFYAAAAWVVEQADLLGVDPDRVALGGDTRAPTSPRWPGFMARDRGGPRFAFPAASLPGIGRLSERPRPSPTRTPDAQAQHLAIDVAGLRGRHGPAAPLPRRCTPTTSPACPRR